MDNPAVQVLVMDESATCPAYAHAGDAGADLTITCDVDLEPGARAVVGTGIAVAIPDGYAGLVYPRSGLAARAGLSMVNSPGVIDAGYRGEIKLCLVNTDRQTAIHLKRGDRVAQMIIHPVHQAVFIPVDQLSDSERGTGGYGSSGGVAHWRDAGVAADNTDEDAMINHFPPSEHPLGRMGSADPSSDPVSCDGRPVHMQDMGSESEPS